MVLERLRLATKDVHRTIDSRFDLLSGEFSLPHYLSVLQIMYAFFSPWENALAQSAGPINVSAALRSFWDDGGARAHKLLHDLESLGSSPDPALRVAAPAPESLGEWLGILYVLEGSRLGGQVISRHLETSLGWTGGRGYSFFAGMPSHTGVRWRRCCALLEAHAQAGNEILAGARQTFASLQAISESAMRG